MSELPEETWQTIVRNVPIPSVDLVVVRDGAVVLGKRTNEPAKGTWFVPGGRIQKGERLRDAVNRVAADELGCSVRVDEYLGTYEHFYDTSDVENASKHYVPTAFQVTITEGSSFEPDDQHESLKWFDEPFPEFHPYVEDYLIDAGILNG